MRFGIILAQHDPRTDHPSHSVSSSLAASFLNTRLRGKPIAIRPVINGQESKHLLWLQVEDEFQELKRMFRSSKGPKPIPRILPPRRPETLLLQYPHPEETSVLPKFSAFKRLCKEAAARVDATP